GMLLQIPHEFFAHQPAKLGFELPAGGEYGIGMVFMPLDTHKREACEAIFEQVVREEGQRVLGWRTVPVDDNQCGVIARQGLPAIRQIFIGKGSGINDEAALERKLYVIRKRVTNEGAKLKLDEGE